MHNCSRRTLHFSRRHSGLLSLQFLHAHFARTLRTNSGILCTQSHTDAQGPQMSMEACCSGLLSTLICIWVWLPRQCIRKSPMTQTSSPDVFAILLVFAQVRMRCPRCKSSCVCRSGRHQVGSKSGSSTETHAVLPNLPTVFASLRPSELFAVILRRKQLGGGSVVRQIAPSRRKRLFRERAWGGGRGRMRSAAGAG